MDRLFLTYPQEQCDSKTALNCNQHKGTCEARISPALPPYSFGWHSNDKCTHILKGIHVKQPLRVVRCWFQSNCLDSPSTVIIKWLGLYGATVQGFATLQKQWLNGTKNVCSQRMEEVEGGGLKTRVRGRVVKKGGEWPRIGKSSFHYPRAHSFKTNRQRQ